jgi:hypothetical protein
MSKCTHAYGHVVMHGHCLMACRTLSHPNIVTTYGCGWIDLDAQDLTAGANGPQPTFALMMEFADTNSLLYNIQRTNLFGHRSVRPST